MSIKMVIEKITNLTINNRADKLYREEVLIIDKSKFKQSEQDKRKEKT